MPILRVKEIREQSHEDRQKRLNELRNELVRLMTMIKAGGSIENPARVHELRKAIARILTIESEPTPPKKLEKAAEKTEKRKRRAKKKPKEVKEREEGLKE